MRRSSFSSCTLVSLVVFLNVAENIARVRERIDEAARRARRNPANIELMAVTKEVSADPIRKAYEAGIRVFGENRVQEFGGKCDALRDLSASQWHMIGHLQTNKVNHAAKLFDAVDSLDSVRLTRKLNSAARELGKKFAVLIEINIGGEQAKSGTAPDSAELNQLLSIAPELSSLEFLGLMTVPPYHDDPEKSRPYFRRMRDLFQDISRRQLPAMRMEVLSMGMSDDFEVAIEEGSTCVRLGTAIFGERKSVRSPT
jgi:pyridoxal phosphate enzyme (YggS family)